MVQHNTILHTKQHSDECKTRTRIRTIERWSIFHPCCWAVFLFYESDPCYSRTALWLHSVQRWGLFVKFLLFPCHSIFLKSLQSRFSLHYPVHIWHGVAAAHLCGISRAILWSHKFPWPRNTTEALKPFSDSIITMPCNILVTLMHHIPGNVLCN